MALSRKPEQKAVRRQNSSLTGFETESGEGNLSHKKPLPDLAERMVNRWPVPLCG